MKFIGQKLGGHSGKVMGSKLGNYGKVMGQKMNLHKSRNHSMHQEQEKEKTSGLEKGDYRSNVDHINVSNSHLPLDGQELFQHHGKKMSDRKSWQRKKHG
jgi:hypothetical protein